MSEHTKGYEITHDGRVLSLDSNWRGYGKREMAQTEGEYGYLFVRLTIDGKRTTRLVHVLVATKFHGPKPSAAHEVRHLDGNRKNNTSSNLMWGTAKENAEDRDRHGRTSRGPSHSAAIRASIPNPFSDAELLSIRRLTEKGWTQRQIAERLGRSQSGVGHVIRGLK
jgi:hypothetical protein